MNDDFYRGLMWTYVLTNIMLQHADKIGDSEDMQWGYRLAIREMRVAIESELEDIQESHDERTS